MSHQVKRGIKSPKDSVDQQKKIGPRNYYFVCINYAESRLKGKKAQIRIRLLDN